jgi:integrase
MSELHKTNKKAVQPHVSGSKRNYGWQSELRAIVESSNHMSVNGDRRVGRLTKQSRIQKLYQGFHELIELGYKIQNPRNFNEKHMKVLASYWEEKGLNASTIQNRISVFRTFADWIGKEGMIKESEAYVSDPKNVKRSQVAKRDMSWTAAGFDIVAKLQEIEAYSKHAAAQLLMIQAFGLRRMEALSFKPNRNWEHVPGTEHGAIRVRNGTKGGRERIIVVSTSAQINALKYARAIAGSKSAATIGYPYMTLEQSCKHYNYILSKFGLTKKELGVTGHGLRHQYANNRFEELSGMDSPVRAKTLPEAKTPEMQGNIQYAKSKVSEELGHSRTSITAAYIGNDRYLKKELKALNEKSEPESNNVPNPDKTSKVVNLLEGGRKGLLGFFGG